MAKRVILMILSIILFNVIVVSAVSDVAYLYRNSYKIDENVIETFNKLGLTVDLINEDNQPASYNGYRFLFIGDENFRNEEEIPVNEYPTIVSSYHDAVSWGLTDTDGVSRMVSNSPLLIVKNGDIFSIYTKSNSQGKSSLPYYYLDQDNKAFLMEQVAATQTTSSGYKFGDVVSYAHKGIQLMNGETQQGSLCFFGIVESDYWTPEAKQLFEKCVEFVALDTTKCFSDGDCPEDEFSERFCQGNDVYHEVTSSHCQNPGKIKAKCVSETEDVLVEECEFVCFEGQCMGSCNEDAHCDDGDEYTKDVCNLAGTPNSYCSYEQIICLSNLDCDDGDDYTYDVCNSAGSVDSYCSYEPILCWNNLDCGIDGFVGDLFCSANNVSRDFVSYACNNAGSVESFCSSATEEKIIETCEDVCIDGVCETIECYADGDCDDGDNYTKDICNSAGSVDSYCSYEPILCWNNLDCGIDGFVGDLFCAENNLTQLFESHICNNSGSVESFCSSVISPTLIEACEFGCWNGSCLEFVGIHDISFLDFANAVNKIRIEDMNGTDISDGGLGCGEDYKIYVQILNAGNFIENVSFSGAVDSLVFEHNPIIDFAPGFDSLKSKIVNLNLSEGYYNITVEATLDEAVDENPLDNLVSREVFCS